MSNDQFQRKFDAIVSRSRLELYGSVTTVLGTGFIDGTLPFSPGALEGPWEALNAPASFAPDEPLFVRDVRGLLGQIYPGGANDPANYPPIDGLVTYANGLFTTAGDAPPSVPDGRINVFRQAVRDRTSYNADVTRGDAMVDPLCVLLDYVHSNGLPAT